MQILELEFSLFYSCRIQIEHDLNTLHHSWVKIRNDFMLLHLKTSIIKHLQWLISGPYRNQYTTKIMWARSRLASARFDFSLEIWTEARPSMASTPAVGSVVKCHPYERRRSHLSRRWSAYLCPQLIWEGVGSRQARSRHECNYPPLPDGRNLLLALIVSLIFCKVP